MRRLSTQRCEDGDAQGSCLLSEEQEQCRHHPDEAHVPQVRSEFEDSREQGCPDGVLEKEKKEGLHMHKSVHGIGSFGKKELRVEVPRRSRWCRVAWDGLNVWEP